LITGLVVDQDRMAANLAAAAGIEAEQQAMADLIRAERSEEHLDPAEPSKEYLGATDFILDRILARADQRLRAVR
jgi:adenylosuccinate lyase